MNGDGPTDGPGRSILTLEPLLDAVREGMEGAGWALSGLQKTTSHEFEGRWAGESTRSAYLFFHRDDLPEWTAIDVYLDETTRGLKGNLALVLDGPRLGELREVPTVLRDLAAAGRATLLEGYRTPITLRVRMPSTQGDPSRSETEYRFKIHIPGSAFEAGAAAVVALTTASVEAFERLLRRPELAPYLLQDEAS